MLVQGRSQRKTTPCTQMISGKLISPERSGVHRDNPQFHVLTQRRNREGNADQRKVTKKFSVFSDTQW